MASRLHSRILESTSIVGGSSVLNVLFRLIQGKAVALLAGPSGVGLMGLLVSTAGLASAVASMGLGSSGVRAIARAAASGDDGKLATTLVVLRRLAYISALTGAVVSYLLRDHISLLALGTKDHAFAFGLLAIVVGFAVLTTAQTAVIQGMRRVGDLARATVLGVATGTVIGLPALVLWSTDGVAPYLVVVSTTTLFFAWWYARKTAAVRVSVTRRAMASTALPMLSMGAVFMAASLVGAGATYFVRILIIRDLGLPAAGLFEAASALASVYISFILAAMGSDFFPHLTAVANDDDKSRALINAQVEIGLLVATPGILAVLALGPFSLEVLYSSSFAPAFAILRWQALGTLLRAISWPLGYVLLARGRGGWYFVTESITYLVYIPLVLFFLEGFGLPGVGMAFAGMYLFYTGLMVFVARHCCRFRWSPQNRRLQATFLPLVILACACSYLPSGMAMVTGGALTLGVGVYSLRSLYLIIGPDAARMYVNRIGSALWRKSR